MYRSSIIFSILLLMSTIITGGMLAGPGIDHDDNGSDFQIIRTRSTIPESWPVYKGDLQHTGLSSTVIPMKKDTRPLWTSRVPFLKQSNTPTIHENVAYIGSGDGTVRGLDIDSGEVVWNLKASFKHINTPITIDSGNIYFGADDGHVYGYDIETKTKQLDVYTNSSSIYGAPIVADSMLFIGTQGKNLQNAGVFGIDMVTGNISWTFNMGEDLNIYGFKGTPAYQDGKVYIGSGDGFMYCFDADGFTDGNDGYDMEENTTIGQADIIWVFNATSSIVGSPMIAEGSVVFGNDIGWVYCLDVDDGTLLWSKKIGAGESPSIQTSPSYHDGIVYFAAQRVYGVYNDKKGSSIWAITLSNSEVQWRFNTTGQMLASSPALTEDALVFGSGAGNTSVFCISTVNENLANEDRILWRSNLGAPLHSAPAIADGRVFIARTDPRGESGKVYSFGSPDPSLSDIEFSDPLPFMGERITINARISNNATIGADISVRFMLTNFNNSNQKELAVVQDARVEAFSETMVSADWVVEAGFDMVVVFIIEVAPEDMDSTNNFGTKELSIKNILDGYWTSSGSGPERDGIGLKQLESNRTFWSKDLGTPFMGEPESVWYQDFDGNGTISAAGGILYMSSPEGDLLALNSTPAGSGSPGEMWRYTNSSVKFIGRPVLIVDKDQTFGGSNKVFAYGDDSALWSFDWVGFWDGTNDGPFLEETSKGGMNGDVIWRTTVNSAPSQPLFVSGANVIMVSDTKVRAYDDDTGSVVWTRTFSNSVKAIAGYNDHIFLVDGEIIRNLDPITGNDVITFDISSILGGHEAEFISLGEDTIFLSHNDTLSQLDAFPDDNGDGKIDLNDTDEGNYDNGSRYDLLWSTRLGGRIRSPSTYSSSNSLVTVSTEEGLTFLYMDNGTIMNSIGTDVIWGRVLSAQNSIYTITGTGPWILRAFTLSETDTYLPTWTQTFQSEPRGEPALVGGRIYLSVSSGQVFSIGAANNEPISIISSPSEGMLVFPGEILTLDASSSYDLEGDPLTYMWFFEGTSTPIYEGPNPQVTVPLEGVGKKRLVLRVYDDMRAYSQSSVNITLLKRITSPDYHDNYNDIHIHMSFGISESSGAYFINSTETGEAPSAVGAVFISYIEFTPLPKYAQYRFEWANISIGYSGKEFPIGMHKEKLGVFMYDPLTEEWLKAPLSGVDLAGSMVWGNFTDLLPTYYAIGILDNNLPEFRHRVSSTYVSFNDQGHVFRVEYRDSDGNVPRYLKLVIDNDTEYSMELDGVQGNMSRYTFYKADGISLAPGWHSYYFETDDGFFIIRSDYFTKVVDNNPPTVNIIGPQDLIRVRENVQFSGDGSADPDGDTLSYYWDFDASDGIDREKAGKVVDKIFYSPGVYRITLTVSDGTTSVSKNLTVTVIDDEEVSEEGWEQYFPLILACIIAFLFIAIVVFIMISRKGHEEQSKMTRDIEMGWSCPECGSKVQGGLDECYECGYEYDPLDFEDDYGEM